MVLVRYYEHYYSASAYEALLQKLGAKPIVTEPITIYAAGDIHDPAAVEFLLEEQEILEGIGQLQALVSIILVPKDKDNGLHKVIEVRHDRVPSGCYVVGTHHTEMRGDQLHSLQWDCNCKMARRVRQGESDLPVCRHVLMLWMLQSKSNAEETSNMLDELLREYAARLFAAGYPLQLAEVEDF